LDEQNRRTEHGAQEVAFLFKPALKIVHSIHGGIYLASKSCIEALKEPNDFLKAGIPNDHEIDITFRTSISRGDRSIDESDINFPLHWVKGVAEYVNHSYCLDQDLLEFREYRTLAVGLIINAISIETPSQEPGFC